MHNIESITNEEDIIFKYILSVNFQGIIINIIAIAIIGKIFLNNDFKYGPKDKLNIRLPSDI